MDQSVKALSEVSGRKRNPRPMTIAIQLGYHKYDMLGEKQSIIACK